MTYLHVDDPAPSDVPEERARQLLESFERTIDASPASDVSVERNEAGISLRHQLLGDPIWETGVTLWTHGAVVFSYVHDGSDEGSLHHAEEIFRNIASGSSA